MLNLFDFLSQSYPPKPAFTEKDIPQLRGKVYIVTGSNSGIGKLVAQTLYSKHAKVYIAARSKERALEAIDEIKRANPESAGDLAYLRLDLADLSTIKASAEEFLSKESKLHVLWNNAGIMLPPAGSKSPQGYELQLAVNNIGTFMFTKLLTPTLIATAKKEPPSTVRVVWVASSAAEGMAPQGGVPMENLDYHDDKMNIYKYGVSKAGNYLHATEFAKRFKADGVVSIPLNPGNLNTDLWRAQGGVMKTFLKAFLLHPPVYGSYTLLFAGLSPKITIEKTGAYVAPWGRFMNIRKDLVQASKSKAEGGTAVGEQFWQWNEEQVKPYL